MEHEYSLADIRAATDHDRDDGWGGGGNGAWWILILFFLFIGGNGMWGNRGMTGEAVATNADIQRGFDTNEITRKLDGITNGLCDGFYAVNNGFHGIDNSLCTGFNNVNQNINQARFDAQQCCCETNRNIDSLRSEGFKNTCEITNAIHCESEQTRALINANSMQALREKLADKDRELQTANFQLSQQAQTANLVNQLKPCPVPAYPSCSPYTTFDWGNLGGFGFERGCGCNRGCGCA